MAMFWTDIYQNIIFVETKKTIYCRYFLLAVAAAAVAAADVKFQPLLCSKTATLWSSSQTKSRKWTKWAQTYAQIKSVFVLMYVWMGAFKI